MNSQKEKKIPKKNYIILAVIYLVVIAIVLYFASWYNTYQDYQKETPVLRNTVFEINTEEIDHYLMENPNCMIYLCAASDDDCRSFELQFKKEILKNEWQDSITYLNLDSVDNIPNYLNTFISQYNTANFKIERIPALIAFEDGKITAIVSGINKTPLTGNEAKQFIKNYHIEY